MDSTSLEKPDKLTDGRTQSEFKREIVWTNVFAHLVLHLMGLYGLYVYIVSAKLLTCAYVFLVFIAGGAGVTISAHRYFTHRSFKATFRLRCFLTALFILAGENSLYIWVRDHRQHHKYSDTDADPHNSSRGFFFSHCGWLMMRKHPEVIEKGKTIDISDLKADPVVRFQEKYYILLYIALNTVAVVLPSLLWGESLQVSFWTVYGFRNVLVYNSSWLVNSLAHFYGTKPYDKNIRAVENLIVSLVTVGEGWHNFHHTFPSDYRAAEYGQIYDLTTMAIESLQNLGSAYDLRQTPQYLVNKWVKNFGDGNHPLGGEEEVPLATQDTPLSTNKIL